MCNQTYLTILLTACDIVENQCCLYDVYVLYALCISEIKKETLCS